MYKNFKIKLNESYVGRRQRRRQPTQQDWTEQDAQSYYNDIVNMGAGEDMSIAQMAQIFRDKMGIDYGSASQLVRKFKSEYEFTATRRKVDKKWARGRLY